MSPREGAERLFDLTGRVAVVTGAAGQLGQAFCRALAGAGARVVAADVEVEKARELARSLGPAGTEAELDVTSRASVERFFAHLKATEGRIDILVNNAGIAVFTPFERRTDEEFMNVVNVNMLGVFHCAQAAGRLMADQGSGAIINLGSIYGVVAADQRIYADSGRNSSEVYAFTKGGVIAFTRYLAAYLAPRGVRVNCLSPGGVFNNQAPVFVENYSRRTPAGRMAEVTDLTGALIFLASDAARYVTGQNLIVDGGFTSW